MIYNIYTDGSALGKTPLYFGGWAVVVFKEEAKEENLIKTIGGSDYPMTNNKAELTALLNAIKFAKEIKIINDKASINIYSDSQYSLNCILLWSDKWKNNGWLNNKKEPVANKELIDEIKKELLFTANYIKLLKVKGHSNDYGNYMADKVATEESKNIKNNIAKEKREV